MRRGLMAAVFGACSFVANAEKPSEVVHIEALTYEEAMGLAEAEDRRVYLLFKGEHCSWCEKQMAEFKDRRVAEAMDGMVFCVVDVYSNRDLSKRYGVSSVPAHRLLEPKGDIIRSRLGYMEAKALAGFLKD
jgi:thioredoxin-related protein